MAVATATAMDAIAIGEFLSTRQTGVLAMADAGSVYAIPVSFAYDEVGPAIYFRFASGPDSQKRRYVDGADAASFVVYDRTDEGWKSVVAEGHLESVAESNLDTAVEAAVKALQIPFFEVHRRPASELEFTIMRLDVAKLSGVVEARYRR